jgi:hypothetical protein
MKLALTGDGCGGSNSKLKIERERNGVHEVALMWDKVGANVRNDMAFASCVYVNLTCLSFTRKCSSFLFSLGFSMSLFSILHPSMFADAASNVTVPYQCISSRPLPVHIVSLQYDFPF